MIVRLLVVAFIATLLGTGARAQATQVEVVEFYNATLDHYFISSLADDIAALDSGRAPGWSRTGLGFKAYGVPAAATSPVCRFYIPPALGDSHFYSASPSECEEVRQKFPSFVYEAPAVMHVGLPAAAGGACAAGEVSVYRLWNKRADSNHRYTTDRAVRDAMIAKGYVPEGYGPDGVAMCAVGTVERFSISVAPASILLLPGETRDVWVTVYPSAGYAGTVDLVANGAADGVQHSIASPSLTVGTVPVSINVRVSASSSAPLTVDLVPIRVTASERNGFASSREFTVGVVEASDPIALRLRTIASIETRTQELSAQGLTRLSLVQAVATHMATLPAYAASGVDEETIAAWGRFSDGTLHIVADNRDPPSRQVQMGRAYIKARDGGEIPGRVRAKLLHSFGRNFQGQTAVDEMRSYLTSKGWAVDFGAEGDASVETIKSVHERGFFYINSHSARIPVPDPSEPDGKMFAVQTSTLVDKGFDRVYAAELATLQLVPFTAVNGEEINHPTLGRMPGRDTRYAFTYRFVDRFMSFPRGSVVFLNGCFSSRDDKFVDAFLRKGAGLYLGWTDNVDAGPSEKAPTYFVDRMLGANKHSEKESTPQRAFPADLVLADMAVKGHDVNLSNNGKLTAFRNRALTESPIFAPSIRMVAIDENKDLLTLHGFFGTDRGTVTVDGESVAVIDWTPGEIVTMIPAKGTGSSGDVVVEVRGVKSNARQITRWAVGLDFTREDRFFGTFKYTGTGVIRFRADVGGWRTLPGKPVQFFDRGGPASKDSKISIVASGVWRAGSCTSTLSGSADYVSIANTNGRFDGSPGIHAGFMVNASTKAAALGITIDYQNSTFVATNSCGGSPAKQAPDFGPLEGSLQVPAGQSDEAPPEFYAAGYRFTLDAGYGFPAKPMSKPGLISSTLYTIDMKAAIADAPPRDTEDAGK